MKSENFSSSRTCCKLSHKRNQTFALKTNHPFQNSFYCESNCKLKNLKDKFQHHIFYSIEFNKIKNAKNYKSLFSNPDLNLNLTNMRKYVTKCIKIKDKIEILPNIKSINQNKAESIQTIKTMKNERYD